MNNIVSLYLQNTKSVPFFSMWQKSYKISVAKQMLPYLHVEAHLAYTKFSHLFVEQMEELNSEVQYLFESG